MIGCQHLGTLLMPPAPCFSLRQFWVSIFGCHFSPSCVPSCRCHCCYSFGHCSWIGYWTSSAVCSDRWQLRSWSLKRYYPRCILWIRHCDCGQSWRLCCRNCAWLESSANIGMRYEKNASMQFSLIKNIFTLQAACLGPSITHHLIKGFAVRRKEVYRIFAEKRKLTNITIGQNHETRLRFL